ncbi:hypothetical protein RQP46_002277 [Phenoliferia psychrophenolica]
MDRTAQIVVPITRGLGLAGVGLILGFQASYPLVLYPAMFSIKSPVLSARARLHLWSKSFDAGKASMLTLIPLTSASLAISAFLAPPTHAFLNPGFVARHRLGFLVTAAALTFVNLPYTAFFILPRVARLKKVEKMIAKEDGEVHGSAELEVDTDPLLMEWLALHAVRVVLAFGALVATVTEAVSV